ncbi:MAG: helix-turn-helix domain-containing protein [Bdellovibrionales bacterium]|nr:helix-turn-helix domain-containing protein [Bdellovibrionales bacterium]
MKLDSKGKLVTESDTLGSKRGVDSQQEDTKIFDKKIAIGSEEISLDKLRWLSTKEAAYYLRVPIGSLKNMVYRGKLVPKKLGRLNRFLRDDLERVIKSTFERKGVI